MACTDMAIRLEVDGLAMGSSASTKSRSLELLLTLHTWSVPLCCSARLEASCPARARCATLSPFELCSHT